ncbi:MAG: 50S ribosomal protein L29 [Litorilinea sp.]
MEAKDVRALTDAELVNQLDDLHQEMFNLRFQKATGKLTNTARVREVKRTVARIKTIQRERELAAAAE